MGKALWGVLVAIFVVIPLSISVLWINERRAAELESLLGAGQGEAETVGCLGMAESDGCLVHLNSEHVRGLEPVQDQRFPAVAMETGCIQLRTTVEVYQWEEVTEEDTKKNNVGGGTTTTTTYNYRQAWSASVVDSSTFQRAEHHNTFKVNGLQPGTEKVVNGLVKYGEHYRLESELAGQLGNFQDVEELVGSSLGFASCEFNHHDDGYYYFSDNPVAPEIGDYRAKVEYVPDGPASILALQKEDKEGERTFAPYRTVRRRLCGGNDDDIKERRLAAAAMTTEELYQQEKCWDFGPFCCLCGCCNLVSMLFSAALPPQIYSIYPGSLSISECFDNVKAAAGMAKWGLRLLAWLGLWIGFNMVLQPLPTFLDIIPFLGPMLSTGTQYLIGFLTFLLTLLVGAVLTSIAYLVYRPLVGAMYLGMTVSAVCLVHYLSPGASAVPAL